MSKTTKSLLILIPVGLLLTAGGLAWWAWSLWNAVPGYWRVIGQTDERMQTRAERFEYDTIQTVQQIRPGEPWQKVIDQQRINEWLATRLDDWAVNQDAEIPDWLKDPMVAIEPDRLIIAARIDAPDLKKVISFEYVPVRPEGSEVMELKLDVVRGGKLPLGFDTVMDRARARIDAQRLEDFDELRRRLRGQKLSLTLEDNRKVEVLDIELSDGSMMLTCRTRRQAIGEPARR
jgi:hypothetical protein